MSRQILSVAFVAVIAAAAIQNPVLPADHPDPSVIRFGNQYWAANTSSEWAPIFPLFSSSDLQHWKAESSIFTDPPPWAAANFWAPELTVDRGNIRVYYAARKRDGPLCVAVASAEHPAGPYSDHGPLVCQEDGSIDPFFIRDENGQPYLLWKEDGNSRNLPSIIYAQRTTDDGLRLTDKPVELIQNTVPWEGKVVEGPDVVRHGDFYYLFYAGGGCCGRGCNYGVGVARSRKLLGPWEKYPANPIVSANSQWQCPGHGTAVVGPDGSDYFLYHAYSRRGFIYTGREALLDRIAWRNGWPSIDDGNGPSAGAVETPPPVHDDFRANSLRAEWQWPLSDHPAIQPAASGIVLAATPSYAGDFMGALLARSLASLNYSAEVSFAPESLDREQAAGLAIVGDRQNAAGIALRSGRIIEWRIDRGKWVQLAERPAPHAPLIRLRIQARNATQFRTWLLADGGSWTEVGSLVDVTALPPWDRGLRIALFASGTQGGRFTDFDLRYGPSE